MSQKIGEHRITITVSPEQLERIEKIMKRHDIKKAQVVRNVMDVGLDVYDELSIIGIRGSYELYEKCKGWINKQKSFRQTRLI
jgi:hypothetical protein